MIIAVSIRALTFSLPSLLLIFLLGLFSHGLAASETTAPPQIVVVDDASYAPFSFLDGSGNPAGITVDIWRLWSRKTGIPVEFRLMRWNAALAAVHNNEADAFGGLFKTEDREQLFDFTQSFFTITTSVFFHEQIHGIRGLDDLHGFPIGVVSGDSAKQLILQHDPKAQMLAYPGAEELIKAAVQGEIKVFVADSKVARFYLAKYDQKGAVRETSKPVATNLLYSAVRKGNEPMLAVLRDGFSRISENEIKEIVAAWKGRSLFPHISWADVRLYGSLFAALIGCVVLWNFQLRRTVRTALQEVEQRNRQLRDSETRLKTFFDLAPFSCVVNDLQGRFRMVNKVFCDRLGLPEEAILGRTGEELGLYADQDFSTKAVAEVLRNGEAIQRELTRHSPQGPRQVLHSSRLMELEGEQLILSAAVDITDRIRAEEALRESEERFSKAFASSPAPMVISDIVTGRFIDVNEQWLRMLEHTREETIGRTSYEQGIWEDADTRTRLGKKLKEAGAFRDEPIRFITKSGKIKDAMWSAEKVNLGGEEVMLSLIFDCTERKKAEDALRESESYNKLLFHDSHIPLAVLDPESGRLIDCNQAAARLYGCAHQSELLGEMPQDFSVPVQYDGQPSEAAAVEKINAALEQGYAVFDWQHQRPNGELWDGEVHLMVFTYGRKKLIQLSLQDITGRKQAELEKEKLQQQLLQSQKMESVGRLAGGVAHDFNNMLSVILGHTELALQQTAPGEPLFNRLQSIQEAAQRSADLTRQLLAFARKQTVAPKVLDLNETVAGMLEMLRRLTGENLDFAWMPDPDAGPVRIDPTQINQLLVNLCVNARDAIDDTGKVTIETGSAVFDTRYCARHPGFVPGDYVLLAVSDNGCGMSPETISHLFEPFFTTKDLGKGTGLGLATVYGIVKQNNGFINVYSEPGCGSTFKIYLPRHTGQAEYQEETTLPDTAAHGRETILVVEDNSMILDITKAMLELQGYTVLPAATPGEALRMAHTHAGAIHLLMTDVIMPEMNGRDLASKLQALSPGLKCLFMSGYTANVIAHHGVLDEGVHFIAKPFSVHELAVKVGETLASPSRPSADRHPRTKGHLVEPTQGQTEAQHAPPS
jgi:PAS domain S-box-containing protein